MNNPIYVTRIKQLALCFAGFHRLYTSWKKTEKWDQAEIVSFCPLTLVLLNIASNILRKETTTEKMMTCSTYRVGLLGGIFTILMEINSVTL